MTEDFIDKTLSTLDDYYPGSKRKRREKPIVKVTDLPTDWDTQSFKKTMPNGEDLEMFTIGALAKALGRPVPTLRKWMRLGYLPIPPYRLPDAVDKYGVMRKGRRLYSRAMVEAAVEVFNSSGLFNVDRIDWSLNQHVQEELAEAWNKIRAEETKTN